MPEASISCPGRAKVRKPPALTASVANVHMRPACMCHRDFGPAGILVRADQNPQEAAR